MLPCQLSSSVNPVYDAAFPRELGQQMFTGDWDRLVLLSLLPYTAESNWKHLRTHFLPFCGQSLWTEGSALSAPLFVLQFARGLIRTCPEVCFQNKGGISAPRACAFDLLWLPETLWRRNELSVSQQELGSAGSVSGFLHGGKKA